MRVIHLISGGDVGGAKTHVLSLLQGLNQAHRVLLVCFMEGPFAQEAREMGIPTQVLPGWNIPRIICRLEELIRTEHFQIQQFFRRSTGKLFIHLWRKGGHPVTGLAGNRHSYAAFSNYFSYLFEKDCRTI